MHNAAACGNSQSDEWRLDNATRLRVLHSRIIRYCRRNSALPLPFPVSPSPHLTLVNPLGNPP